MTRSLPDRKALRGTKISVVLSALVEEHGIEAVGLTDADGLKSAYEKGYLHSAYIDEGGHTLYDFLANLHHWYMFYLLFCISLHAA